MADVLDTDPTPRILDKNVAGLNNNMNNNGCSSPGIDDEEVEATLPGSTAGAILQDEPQEEAGSNEVTMTVPYDPDHTEDRFRVDRKKLEQMLQAQGESETGEEFFQRIMEETETHISWPSKLKIGAKSKKDPHIKVTGKPGNVASAKDKIMSVLDTKSNRVTLKMDVSYTEHSHVIGKGGNIIKKVMEDTGCHIHFPDSNRGSQQEKSNQVSIAGQVCGVEKARFKIRELLPLVLFFELPITGTPTPDMNSPTIQQIVQAYNVSVNMKQRSRGYSTTVTVRGASNNAAGLKEGTVRLMEHLTGSLGQVTLPVSTQIEIAPQHHQFMIGRGGLNIKQIMQGTGATIHFPDPNNAQRKSSVFISGPIDSVIIARHLLMGCLPLVLMFDIKEDVEVESSTLAQMMEQLDVFISVKPKPKQPSKSVIVKSIERNAPNMYLARQKLLGQECESCAAHHAGNNGRGLNGSTLPLTGLNVGSMGLLGQGGLNINTANVLRINGLNGMSAVHSASPNTMGTSSAPSIQPGLQATVSPVLIQQAALNSLLQAHSNQLQANQTNNQLQQATHALQVNQASNQLQQATNALQQVNQANNPLQQATNALQVNQANNPLQQAANALQVSQATNSLQQATNALQMNQATNHLQVNQVTNPLQVNPTSNPLQVNQANSALQKATNALQVNQVTSALQVNSTTNRLQVNTTTSHLQANLATNPLQVNQANNPVQQATNALQINQSTNPLQVSSATNPLQVNLTSNPLHISQGSNPLQVGQVANHLHQAINAAQINQATRALQVNQATNLLQGNQASAAGLIPTTLTPTISTSLTPGLTTTSLMPGLPPCTASSIMPTSSLATSLAAGMHGTSLSPNPAQTLLSSAFESTISRHSHIPSVVHVTSSLPNLSPPTSLMTSVVTHPFPVMARQPTPSTQSIQQMPPPVATVNATLPGGDVPSPRLATGITPRSLPTSSPLTVPTRLTPQVPIPQFPPPLMPPPKSTDIRQEVHMPAMSQPQQTAIHKPSPPPGFSPRPDPATVTAQLAQLDMGRGPSTTALLHNNGSNEHPVRHSAFVRVSKQLQDSGGSCSNSSSGSPTSSPSNSPIDLIATSTTSPLHHLCNNNNKLDLLTKNNASATTLIELLSRNNMSPNNSGNFSSYVTNGPIEQISPSNSCHFASRLGQHISPSNSGNFSSMFGPGGGVQQDQNGLNRSNSRPSSESGGESDSSDKRAPGCERRKSRERERERQIEQSRQQELDGLMQDGDGFTYEQKKLMANKAMKQKPVVTQPRIPTDTWSGLGFSKSMPESALKEARQKNGFSLFQRPALPTMHESSIHEEEPENESSWPPDKTGSEPQPIVSPTSTELNTTPRKKKFNPYDPLSRSNYIDSTSLPRYTKGLWSNEDMDSNSKEDEKEDLSELFIKLGLSKYTSVFQQQEIDLTTFSTLTDGDLKELGITTFGARRKMLLAISDLNKNQVKSFQVNGGSGLNQTSNNHYNSSNQRGHMMGSQRLNETPASCW